MIDAWLGKGKVFLRPDKIAKNSRDECESILSKLLLEQIVREDFHFTPFSTISYLIQGPRWFLLKQGQISITLDTLNETVRKCIEIIQYLSKQAGFYANICLVLQIVPRFQDIFLLFTYVVTSVFRSCFLYITYRHVLAETVLLSSIQLRLVSMHIIYIPTCMYRTE